MGIGIFNHCPRDSGFFLLVDVEPATETPDVPLEILWQETKTAVELKLPIHGKSRGRKRSKNGNAKTNHKFKFNEFAPNVVHSPYGSENTVGDSTSSSEDLLATMNNMGLAEYSSNLHFFEKLKIKIDHHTVYPLELLEHKMEGQVWVKVLINSKGQLIKVMDLSGKSSPLEAYVIIGVYQALKDPLPVAYHYTSGKDMALHLHFDFKTHPYGMRQNLRTAKYFKNSFHFTRLQNVPNLLQDLNTYYARYMPPFIITPAGPTVDFIQIYNMVKAWNELDPLMRKNQREHLTKEKLQILLQKAELSHQNQGQ